jgi:type IV secretory pathway VirB2 component (pilin)
MTDYKIEINEKLKLSDKIIVKRLWDSLSLNLAAIIIAIGATVYFGTKNIWLTLISIIIVILILKYGKNLFIQVRHFID